jgi:hypothetical protein
MFFSNSKRSKTQNECKIKLEKQIESLKHDKETKLKDLEV